MVREEVKNNKLGSVGTLIPGCKSKIVDPETGSLRSPGDKGEICIQGPNVSFFSQSIN